MELLNLVSFEELFSKPLRNGLTRPKAVRGSGTKMINMGELFAHTRIKNIQADRVPLSKVEDSYLLEEGDLLFARQSLVLAGAGKCSIFICDDEPITYEGHIIRARLNKEIADPFFYYYFFNSPIGRDAIHSIVEQVAAAGVRGSDLAKLKVPCISLPEQRAIAEVLGSLDDKIELNRRMNAMLEQLAQAVFQECFMDNPDAECWGNGSILEFADLLSGGTPRTEEPSYWNGDIDWVSAKDVGNAKGLFLLSTEKKITQTGIDHSSTKILPEKTTIVTARGTVGAYCLLGRRMAMNQTNYGLKAKDGVGDYFVFFTLKNMVEQLRQQSYGTIFDTITTRTFRDSLCAQPPVELIRKFEREVSPFMDAILNNQEQSQTLANLRDTLLPKLMRGEMRIYGIRE
jgi:type I restriction enzyme, S subunit